jgi:hypothetical protein
MRAFPASCKDSLRIIMTLVAHYDLELYQINENVYMALSNGLSWKEKNIWDTTWRNPFMDWSEPLDGGI